MPEIKIVTEVAGRVCALPVEAGASIGDGDDVAFVEAMKMEIPVRSTAAGKIKSILVSSTTLLPRDRPSRSSRRDAHDELLTMNSATICPLIASSL